MTGKKIIAFIGVAHSRQRELMEKFLDKDFSILLVSEQEEYLANLKNEFNIKFETADIETFTCAKNACWEADVLFILQPPILKEEIIHKIKEVSTKKPIVLLANEKQEELIKQLKNTLPYSILLLLIWKEPNSELISLDDEVNEESLWISKHLDLPIVSYD